MNDKAVRLPDDRPRTARTRSRTRRPGGSNHSNGHQFITSRRRTRTDRPWYARQIRQSGTRLFGWSFGVVLATPSPRHAAREFRTMALTTWLVALAGCLSLALFPSTWIAIGGTAVLLLVAAFFGWMLGDDDARTSAQTSTIAQLVCASAIASLVAIAAAVLLILLLDPLADLTIRLFDIWGLLVYFGVILLGVLMLVPMTLLLLLRLVRSFAWSRGDLLLYPVIPLGLLFLATLTRLSIK